MRMPCDLLTSCVFVCRVVSPPTAVDTSGRWLRMFTGPSSTEGSSRTPRPQMLQRAKWVDCRIRRFVVSLQIFRQFYWLIDWLIDWLLVLSVFFLHLLLLVSPPSTTPMMRLSQDSSRLLFCFWLLPNPGSFRFFSSSGPLGIVLPDFVLWEFLGLLPGGGQSPPGRVRRPVGPKRNLSR